MTTTINVTLPEYVYKYAKKMIKEKKYSSMSALVSNAVRKTIYDPNEITENGFPRWLEERALEVSKTSTDDDVVLKTDKDVDKFFKKLHQEIESERHGKNS